MDCHQRASYVFCVVPSCGANSKINPYRTYHRIPDQRAHPERRARWLHALGITEAQLQIVPQSISKPPCICNIHFTDKFARQQRVQVPTKRLCVAERDNDTQFKKEPEDVDEFQTTEELPSTITELGAEEVVETENCVINIGNVQTVLETLDQGVNTYLSSTPKRRSDEANLSDNDNSQKRARCQFPKPTQNNNISRNFPQVVHDYSRMPQNCPEQHQQDFLNFPAPLPNLSYNVPPMYNVNHGNYYVQNATQTTHEYHRRLIEQNFSRNVSNISQFPNHQNMPGFINHFQRFHPGATTTRAPILSTLLTREVNEPPAQMINDELMIEIPHIKTSLVETDTTKSYMVMGDPSANLNTVQKVREGYVLKLSLQVPIKFVYKKS